MGMFAAFLDIVLDDLKVNAKERLDAVTAEIAKRNSRK